MASMTTKEREEFLADLHVGVIAVERDHSAPLTIPIWYGYQPGGEVTLWTEGRTTKANLIRAAGRFSITVQDEQPPYRYVAVSGAVAAVVAADDAEARAIAVRYLGEEEGNAFADEHLTDDSVIIRMRPQQWLSTDYSKE
jgi:nitroimidazol reductase NimA-like FMN-containing flavoprotein (pyridoxamine 5'-phosphate oxidase superfamily)